MYEIMLTEYVCSVRYINVHFPVMKIRNDTVSVRFATGDNFNSFGFEIYMNSNVRALVTYNSFGILGSES